VTDHTATEDHASVVEPPPALQLPDLGLPPTRNSFRMESGANVVTGDGATLLGDHYVPVTDEPRGTILVRSSYGRGFPYANLLAEPYAARGYHVLMQSVRGTYGSTGPFEPMVHEANDASDTVQWLRKQDWFDGRLGSIGASYLGFTQYGLMMGAPQELKASVVMMGPHDFGKAAVGNGPLALHTFLAWSDAAANAVSPEEMAARAVTSAQRLGPAMNELPLTDAAAHVLDDRAPWFQDWLMHPDIGDPFWKDYTFEDALSRTSSAVLLFAGWNDIFLDQMVEQYTVLHQRGLDVALRLGDWTHTVSVNEAAATMHQQALGWFDEHVAGAEAAPRDAAVRVQLVGPQTWLDFEAWPPTTEVQKWHLGVDESLMRTYSAPSTATASFVFDPTEPTPAVGGRLFMGAGRFDNTELESRDDVLIFTSAPLDTDVDVIGSPTVNIAVSVDNPFSDIFVRLTDVDTKGTSTNVSDTIHRVDPTIPGNQIQQLTLTMDPCGYRFNAGHCARLQVSGGAHPRFARNLGVAEPQSVSTMTAASTHTVHLAASSLSLPIIPRVKAGASD
jgi:putative CocE/NonD family hydrolase